MMNEKCAACIHCEVCGLIESEVAKGGLQNHLYTADYDAKKATNANGVERHTHMTLFTDYILAIDEQTTVQFEMTVSDANKEIKKTIFNTEIPVQRNYLTTIIGDLLTTQANITIEVNDNFTDEWIIGAGDGNTNELNGWGPGVVASNGNYEFEVNANSNIFLVSVNSAAVGNNSLAVGHYVLESDATANNNLTFTVSNLKANNTVDFNTHIVKRLSLWNSSWEAIKNETVLAVGLGHPVRDDTENQFVGHQAALIHVLFRFFAKLRTVGHSLTEHVAGGDGGNVQSLDQQLCRCKVCRNRDIIHITKLDHIDNVRLCFFCMKRIPQENNQIHLIMLNLSTYLLFSTKMTC